MKEQWDRITRENPFYGVLSLDEYEDPASIDPGRFWETGRGDVKMLLEIAGIGDARGMDMLEIGCGLGRMTHGLAGLFRRVIALDVSPEMLRTARDYWGTLPNVEWVPGNGEDLRQLADGSVDFVLSFRVLQHVPKASTVKVYVRESARALKSGGVALLQFRVLPAHASVAALKYRVAARCPLVVQRVLRRLWDAVNGYRGTSARFAREFESWRGSALSSAEIVATALGAGLEVTRVVELGRQSPGTLSTCYVFRKTGDSARARPVPTPAAPP